MEESISKKDIADIKKISTSSKFRNKKKLFILEGQKVVEEILDDKKLISLLEKVFVSNEFIESNQLLVNKIRARKINLKKTNDITLRRVSDTQAPVGIVCLMKQLSWDREKILNESKIGLVLNGINDPGNLGTILRSALAFECDFIALTENCVDVYNPKVVRSSSGAVFKIPVIKLTKGEVAGLKKKGYKIASFSPGAGKVFKNFNYSGKMVFLFGSEARGVEKELEKESDYRVKIPVSDKVESLNVAVACSIVLYEMSGK